MSITLDLPPPINDELTQESQREGISERELAALLVCLASAFKQDAASTPFQKAVEGFLSQHSLDAEHVFSVFEELVRVCLNVRDAGKASGDFQETVANAIAEGDFELLKQWRDSFVHRSPVDGPLDVSAERVLSSLPPSNSIGQMLGRTSGDMDDENEARDPREHVRALLAQWQAQDNMPVLPTVATRDDETPTQALFRKWKEEDANLTEDEQEQDEKFWEEFQKSINMGRAKRDMRTLF